MKKVALRRIVACLIATTVVAVSHIHGSQKLSPAMQVTQKIEDLEVAMRKAIEKKIKAEQEYQELKKKHVQLNIDVRRRSGEFYGAINAGNIEKVKKLIMEGAYINPKLTRLGPLLPLSAAAAFGRPEIVKFLIGAGAEVNAINIQHGGNTALHYAKTPEIVKILAAAGANVDKKNSSWGATPLISACARRGKDVPLALIEAGADIDLAATHGGTTPLWLAVRKGNLELAVILLNKGADPNKASSTGITPLIAAVTEGGMHGKRLELVAELIKKGADPRPKDHSRKTALDYARRLQQGFSKKEIIDLLTGPNPALSPTPIR